MKENYMTQENVDFFLGKYLHKSSGKIYHVSCIVHLHEYGFI